MIPPSNILLHVLATFLMPLFLGGPTGNNDPDHARAAALETLSSFRFRDACELFLCVQIVGFSMAALGSMALSMTDGISLSMVLRLRGNANACTRSAETNRRALSAARADTEAGELHAAEQARDAAFHARYTDEQVRAEVAETKRMADTAAQKLRNRQANAGLAAAIEEMKAGCEARVAAEQAEAARTGIPIVLTPLPPLDPSIEQISLEDFLEAPPGTSLFDLAASPRAAAPAEATMPGADPAGSAPGQVPQAGAEPTRRVPTRPVPPQPATAATAAAPATEQPVQTAPSQPAPAAPTTAATVAAAQAASCGTEPAQPATTQPAQATVTARHAKSQPATPQPARAIHHPQPQTDDEARRSAWANAMLHVAAEFTGELPHASPAESRLNKIRANALSSVARTLLSGTQPTPEAHLKWPPNPASSPPGKQRKA